MKCKKCNGTGELRVPVTEHLGTVLYGTEQCDECDGTGEVQTKEDWFCALSTEEKAFALETIIRSVLVLRSPMCHDVYNREFWETWLKQPHNRKDDD